MKIEAIVFIDNGQIYQTEFGLVLLLKKYDGEWKLVKSSRREHKSLFRKGFKNIRLIIPVIITTTVIIGAKDNENFIKSERIYIPEGKTNIYLPTYIEKKESK